MKGAPIVVSDARRAGSAATIDERSLASRRPRPAASGVILTDKPRGPTLKMKEDATAGRKGEAAVDEFHSSRSSKPVGERNTLAAENERLEATEQTIGFQG